MNNPQNTEYHAPPPQQPRITEKLTKPTVTYVLLGITIAIYLAQMATQYFMGFDLPGALGMKINEHIIQGEYWRLITPVFLHGSIAHIAFNMYALYIIGGDIERRFGHIRFILLYFAGAIGGNALSFLMSPNPSLGASTAIFGLLGAQIVFFAQNRKLFGKGARRALQNVITIAAVNLVIGLNPGIDNFGHLGGLIAGLVFTALAGPLLALEGNYPEFKVVDRRPEYASYAAFIANLVLFFVLIRFKF